MKIIKVKQWVEVRKNTIEPLKIIRVVLLSNPEKDVHARAIKTIESLAVHLDYMAQYSESILGKDVENRIRFDKKVPSEIDELNIPKDLSNSFPKDIQDSILYFNYILEMASKIIHIYLSL